MRTEKISRQASPYVVGTDDTCSIHVAGKGRRSVEHQRNVESCQMQKKQQQQQQRVDDEDGDVGRTNWKDGSIMRIVNESERTFMVSCGNDGLLGQSACVDDDDEHPA